MNFEFTPLELPDVILVEALAFEDDRGVFMEQYKQSSFAESGITDVFVQDNLSRSGRGVLRGLHYQLPPFDQSKLVAVATGEIFDVVVDVRRGSETFGRWVAERLSAENHRMMYVPSGFAHGFLVLSDEAVVTYKTGHEYARGHERGIRWDDAEIGIEWPLAGKRPRLSEKDTALPTLAEADVPYLRGDRRTDPSADLAEGRR